MFCKKCGLQLPEGVVICPKCGENNGENIQNYPSQVIVTNQVHQSNGCATGGFVCSLIGGLASFIIPFGYILAPFLIIIGIILSIVGIVKASKVNGTGRGLAIAGLILGIILLISIVIFYYFFISIFWKYI